jgi:signal transduction histidine kinase
MMPLIAALLHSQANLLVPSPIVNLPVPSLRINAASVVATSLDLIFLGIAWEFLGKSGFRLGLWFRTWLTLLGVMWLDVFLFATGAFAGSPGYWSIMQGTLISRGIISLFALPFLYAYLHWQNNLEGTTIENRPVLAILKHVAEMETELSDAQREIARRKVAERALRRSKVLLSATGEMTKVGGWELNGQTREIQWTEQTRRIHEVSAGYEPTLKDAVEFFQPEDRGKVTDAIQRALDSGEPYDMELRFVTARGRRRWIRTICKPQTVDGRTTSLAGAFQDITEQKRTEEALRRQAEELEALQNTVLDITSRHELPALLETIVQRAAGLLGAPGGGLYLCEPGQKEVRCVVSYNNRQDYTGLVLSYGEGAAGVVAETGEPLIVDVYRTWSERAAGHEEDQPFSTGLTAPMIWEGEVTGVIHVLHDKDALGFTRSDLELLTLFANHAAIAVENARLYDRLRSGHERLQALSQRIVEAQEVERRRIARELHDEIGQALTAVRLDLQAARSLLKHSEHEAQLTHTVSVVERTLEQIRNLSLDLRPSLLDDLGLVPALRWYVDRQAQQVELSAHFRADSLEDRLAPELETTCFRIVQEALTNVTRHAQAKRAYVELLKRNAAIEIRIRDDGVGFDVQGALDDAGRGESLGLLSIKERASVVGGEVQIDSCAEVGTEIKVRFPLILASSEGS